MEQEKYEWGCITTKPAPRYRLLELLFWSHKLEATVEFKPNFWLERLSGEALSRRIDRLFGKGTVIELIGSKTPNSPVVITAITLVVPDKKYNQRQLASLCEKEMRMTVPIPGGAV